jgi:hypothetical protein
MTVTVKETCRCGATFEYTGDASCAHLELKGFRAAHMPCRTAPSATGGDS